MNYYFTITTIFVSIIGAVCLEHIGRGQAITIRPSFFLNKIAKFFMDLFELLGYFCAKISSFYELIKWEEIKLTLYDLFKPSFDICSSPLYFIKGYVEEMNIYDHPYMIIAGSITIIILVLYGLYYGQSRWLITSRYVSVE